MIFLNSANLVSIVQRRALRSPHQIAYIFLKNNIEYPITYAELDMRARAIAAYLQAMDMYGKRVLLVYPPGLEFVTAFLGCLYAGVIAIPCASPRLSEFEKSYTLISTIAANAEVGGILTIPDFLFELEKPEAQAFLHERIFLTPTIAITNEAAKKYQKPKLTNETVAYLQYSSGSTSTPKGAVITLDNLTQSLQSTIKAWEYNRHSITLNWAPHSHVYGLICGVLLPLYHGTLAILMATEDFISNPISWLQAITYYKATHGGCPNFGYELCIRDISDDALSELDLKHWRVAVNGGETVQQATLERFVNKFTHCGFKAKQFNSAFGMSEVTGAIAATKVGKSPSCFKLSSESLKTNTVKVAQANEADRQIVSSGKFLSGLDGIIVDPATLLPVAKNQIGEVWLTGRAVARGYWNLPAETQNVFNARLKGSKASYFRTGDLGFIADKELYLVGRLKELLVIYGKKYYPLDLETSVQASLKALPVELTNAVFSVLINDNEEVVFVQEVKAGINANAATEIKRIIRHVLTSQYGVNAHDIVLVAPKSIPKTSSGKLQRKLCQNQYLNHELSVLEFDSGKKSIHSQSNSALAKPFEFDFIKILATVLNISPDKILLDSPVSDYAFDSLNIIKLAAQFNQTFGLQLSPAQLYEYGSLGQFSADLLSTHAELLAKHYHLDIKKNNLEEAHSVEVKPHKVSTSKDIAIIGMSGIFPKAENIEVFWQNLISAKNAITEIPSARWDWQAYKDISKIKWGGFVDGIDEFDAPFFNISPREAELIDPQQRLFLQTTWNAIENAGYNPAQLATHKVGLFVGVYNNDYAELIQKQNITDAYITTGLTHSILPNRISYLLNFTGPSVAVDAACSSSLVALHEAVKAIQQQDCELAIVGGANALLTPTSFLSGDQAGMLSETGSCKTFDKDADGYVRGEGFIALVLKPLDLASQDGDHVYGVIKGTAVNHGGHVSSLTVPNPNAQAEVIQTALQRAQVSPESISYIETHGTGTSLGDPVEINGLKKAFGNVSRQQSCGLGAVKTNIGHLEAAAGLAGVVKVLLAMQHKTLPGNLHFQHLNPYISLAESPFYIVDKNQPWHNSLDTQGNKLALRAGVSSFGFGGSNAHVILEEAPSYAFSTKQEKARAYLIPLSAKTETALRNKIKDLQQWLEKHPELYSLADIAYTLSVGREHFNLRCVFVVESVEELHANLAQSLQTYELANFIINTLGIDETAKKHEAIFRALYTQLLQEIHDTDLTAEQYKEKLLALGNFYTEGQNLDWQQLYKTAHVRIALPGYPFDKKTYWLPKTTTVTLPQQKAEPIKAKVEHPVADTIEQVNISELVKRDLKQNVAELLKHDANNINLTASLSEQGFDSIAFNLLAVQLEEYYEIGFNPTVFFTHHSINDLTTYFLETYPIELSKKYHSSGSAQVAPKTALESPPQFTMQVQAHTQSTIAVIGMQTIMPKSPDKEAFWQHLAAGDNLISEIPSSRWDWQTYYGDPKENPEKTNIKWGGFIDQVDYFDATFFNLSSREANLMDPQHRLFLEVAWETIEDAGYDPHSLANQDVGVFVGVEFNEYANLLSNQRHFHGYNATGNAHTMLSNRVSYFLNLRGPSESIDTACSSALVAINRAVHALQDSECSLALVGGVNLLLTPESFIIANQLGVLSSDGACKTFDKSANGYVRGEGVGVVLLKRLSDAERDGDFIYGIIRGSAVNHGGKSQSLTAPNVTAQSEVIIKALKNAEVSPDTINYIEAHGTGTELGDPIEIEGLKLAFRSLQPTLMQTNYCGIGAVKTNVGHLEPAAGIAGLLKVLLSLQHKKIPGNLHLQELNTHVELGNTPFYLINKTQDWPHLSKDGEAVPRRAGLSSFGFGGTNAHVVLEEALNSHRKQGVSQAPYYLIALSAKDEAALQQKFKDLLAWVNLNDQVDLASLSYTLNAGRSHFNYRAALVVNSMPDLIAKLKQPIVIHAAKTQAADNALLKSIYQTAIHSLTAKNPDLYLEKLTVIADLYTQHFPIAWSELYKNDTVNRIAGLPHYPFQKKRYWFDNAVTVTAAKPVAREVSSGQKEMEMYLKNIFAEKLGIAADTISVEETYETYGVESLSGLEIVNRLEKDFAGIPKTLLYQKNTIQSLAEYLNQNFHDRGENVEAPQSTAIPVSESEIAIIGITGTFPGAKDMAEFWENLKNSKDSITEIPKDRWDYNDYPVQVGAETKYFKHGGFVADVDKFDPLFFNIPPRDAALIDPQERFFLESAWLTVEDAGYTRESIKKKFNNEIGVFAGVTHNFYPMYMAEEWAKGNRIPINTQIFSIANRVSYFMNWQGPSFALDTACSSSLTAIHLACESLRLGECKMAIAGGVNLSLHPSKYHMLGTYNFLSNDGRCASFAEGGAGYVPAEGVATVLLKPLSAAVRDKDRIYAVIKSSSMNHGGKTSGYTVPNPSAQANLIKKALQAANINPRSINYIEAHGTGTSLGDPIEITGLQTAFEEYTQDKQFCAIGSVKSNIGHLESAAGVAQLAKVVLQLQHKTLVPSLHADSLNSFIDFPHSPFYVQRELKPWQPVAGFPLRAGISSFGAGGSNVHLIVEEYKPKLREQVRPPKPPYLFLLSAYNSERLKDYAHNILAYLISDEQKTLSEICYTSQVGREAMAARLAIITSSLEDLQSKLEAFTKDGMMNDIWFNPNAQKNTETIETTQLNQLAEFWINGGKVDWESLYVGKSMQRTFLPAYPFAKRRCWIQSDTTVVPVAVEKSGEIDDWLYDVNWEKQSLGETSNALTGEQWLIFSDQELGFTLQDSLGESIYCFQGEEFVQLEKNVFYINPAKPEHFEKLLQNLSKVNLKGIMYLWSTRAKDPLTAAHTLLLTFKSLLKQNYQHKLLFCLVTRNSQAVGPNECVITSQHHLWSITRIFGAEQAQYDTLLLDLDINKQLQNESKWIQTEINYYNSHNNQIALRNSTRHTLNIIRSPGSARVSKTPIAAIITGGLGALGFEIANYLTKIGTKYLLLTGTTKLPDRSQWQNLQDESLKEKITNLANLEATGVNVLYQSVDVADKTQMQSIITAAEQAWKTTIDSVFHLAGITTDSIPINDLTLEKFDQVFSAKVQGAIVLNDLFEKHNIKHFVLFSSTAALPFFGLRGLSAYSAANAFLDGLAMQRQAQGLAGLSINWAAWAEKGMGHRHDHTKFLKAVGITPITPEQGIKIFSQLLNYKMARIIVMKIDWHTFLKTNPEAKHLAFFTKIANTYQSKTTTAVAIPKQGNVKSQVIAILADLLAINSEELDTAQPFLTYGVDSIVGLQFVTKLGTHFGDIVSAMDLYRYPTTEQMARYIQDKLQSENNVKPVQNDEDVSHLSTDEITRLIEAELKDLKDFT